MVDHISAKYNTAFRSLNVIQYRHKVMLRSKLNSLCVNQPCRKGVPGSFHNLAVAWQCATGLKASTSAAVMRHSRASQRAAAAAAGAAAMVEDGSDVARTAGIAKATSAVMGKAAWACTGLLILLLLLHKLFPALLLLLRWISVWGVFQAAGLPTHHPLFWRAAVGAYLWVNLARSVLCRFRECFCVYAQLLPRRIV